MVNGEDAIQVGILTEGKSTLAMVLLSLVLQEHRPLDIHIVDTADDAVIKRDDVVFAMRLAFDRGVHCGYEHIKERNRAFSVGRLRLLDELRGQTIAFMDDDIVLAPGTLGALSDWARAQGEYGFASPVCQNLSAAHTPVEGRPYYSPGGLMFQDERVRSILREYYTTASDVLDARPTGERLWEKAFLSELFPALGRPSAVRTDALSYHLDYRERPLRYRMEDSVVEASIAKARRMAEASA